MEPRDREVLLEVRQDVKEAKDTITAVRVQQGIDHFILDEHQKRSTQLESRIAPIEQDMQFARRLVAGTVALGGLYEIVRLFL